MSALTNAILHQHPGICGGAVNPLSLPAPQRTGVVEATRCARHAVEYVRVHGYEPGRGAIQKDMHVDGLPETVARWLALGRTIDSIREL